MHFRKFKTRQQAIQKISEYIGIFYNRQRKQERLSYLSPAQFSQRYYANSTRCLNQWTPFLTAHITMKNKGTKEFSIINNWLGWGEPENGLWFIGVEEGSAWSCSCSKEIIESKNKIKLISNNSFTTYSDQRQRGSVNWPIAVVTAKISSIVSKSNLPWQKYREDLLWLNGSGVFNGNLLSLGKPSLKLDDWAAGYKELFGYTAEDYKSYFQEVKSVRYKRFQEFSNEKKPQAIVCFGKSHWNEFESVFIKNGDSCYEYFDKKTKVFEKDRVILTRHFSNGMPDKTVKFIADQLNDWNVLLK